MAMISISPQKLATTFCTNGKVSTCLRVPPKLEMYSVLLRACGKICRYKILMKRVYKRLNFKNGSSDLEVPSVGCLLVK